MPTKRTVLLTALLALLVAASGCSALQGGGTDGAAIAEQSNQAMQDVERYTFEMSMSMASESGMFRVWTCRISLRPSRSGTPTSISRSKRPPRRSA